MTWDVFFLLNY